MKRLASSICALVLVLSCAGCATMFSGTTEKVSFKSKPSGAEVVVGGKSCTTPCEMDIEKGKWQREAIVTKDGYAQQKVVLAGTIDKLYWANLGNLWIGGIVDLATGAWLTYDKEYYVPLSK